MFYLIKLIRNLENGNNKKKKINVSFEKINDV